MKKALLYILMFLFIGASAKAQDMDTIVVGQGTSSHNFTLPGWYGWNREAMLYTTEEVGAPGLISSIAFNISTANSNASNRSIKIYLMQIDDAQLTSDFFLPSWNAVRNQAVLVFDSVGIAFPNTGWYTFDLDDVFFYDGLQNLLVLIEGTGCTTSGGCEVKCQYSTAANMAWYRRKDNSAPDDNADPEGTIHSARSNIRIILEDTSACKKPYGVRITDIGSEFVTVEWMHDTESGFVVEYKKPSDLTWESEFVFGYSHTIPGLENNTEYLFRIKTDCGFGDSYYSSILRVRTACEYAFPIFENFDRTPTGTTSSPNTPECWDYIRDYSSAYAYVYASDYSSAPNCYRLYNSYSNSSDKLALISPILLEEQLSNLRVVFKAKGSSNSTKLKVGYLRDYTDKTSFVEYANFALTSSYAEYMVSFDTLTTSANNIVFMHGQNSTSQYIYLDDILIESISACPDSMRVDVNTFNVKNITTTSVDIFWEEVSDVIGYDIMYRPTGSSSWTEENWIPMPHALSNLIHSTEYEYTIRSICSEGEGSWSPSQYFFTAVELPYQQYFDEEFSLLEWQAYKNNSNPSTLTYNTSQYVSASKSAQLYNSSAGSQDRFYFVSPHIDPATNLSSVQIRFKAKASMPGVTLPVGMINLDSLNSFELVEALPLTTEWNTYIVTLENYMGTNYRVAFGHNNNTTYSYIYLDNVDIDYIPSCPEVANLRVSLNMGDEVTLQWRDIGAPPYTIEYYETGSTMINSETTNDISHIITLTPETDYVFKVRGACDPDLWSDSIIVRTIAIPVALPFFEDFEQPSAWIFTNGTQANKWIIGSDTEANNHGGDYCLYITNDLDTEVYEYNRSSSSKTYAAKNIYFPENGDYVIDYLWKADGEMYFDWDWYEYIYTDYLRVYLAPVEFANYSAGSVPSTAQWLNMDATNSGLNSSSAWQRKEIVFTINNPGVYQLIFYWINNGSGGNNPPAAVDSINVYKLTCLPPRNIVLSELSSTSATVSYTMPLIIPEKVRLYYKETSASNWDSVEVVLTGSPEDTVLQITNLAPNTTYKYVLKAICEDESYSFLSSQYSFTTFCAPILTPFEEKFDNTIFPPSNCWERKSLLYTPDMAIKYSQFSSSTSWVRDHSLDNYAARLNIFGTSTKYWLMTPTLDISQETSPVLQFDVKLTGWTGRDVSSLPGYDTQDDQFIVLFSLDEGVTWNPEHAIVWSNDILTADYLFNDLTNQYRTYTIPLDQYTETVRVAFYGESTVSGSDNVIFVDNIHVGSCPRPGVHLDSLTAQTALISWIAYDASNEWEYAYNLKGFDPDTVSAYYTAYDTSVLLSGLYDNTEYDFYIRTRCSVNEHSPWSFLSFRTFCLPIVQYPYFENFENGSISRECWSVIDGNRDGKTWELYNSSTYAASGSMSYRMYTSGTNGENDDYLISPALELTGNEYLTYKIRQYSTDYNDKFHVLLSTTGHDASDFTIELSPVKNIAHGYTEYNLDLSPYTGVCYIAFHVPSGSFKPYVLYIDDVTVAEYPSCVAPRDIILSDYTINSVTIGWTQVGAPVSWEFAFDTTDLDNFVVISDNPYVLGGLSAGETYNVFIRSFCGSDYSDWSEKISFTLPCETVVTLPFIETFESNSATWPCWRIIDNNQDGKRWTRGTTSSNANTEFGGTSYAYINTNNNAGNNDDYLITPPIELTGNELLRYFIKANSSSDPNDYSILLSTTGFQPEDFTDTLLPLTQISSITYQENVLDLSAYTGQVYIAFHIPEGGLDGNNLYLDDVSVEPNTGCAFPRGIIASTPGRDTVNVRWIPQGDESAWECVAVPAGNSPDTGIPVPSSESSITILGLLSGTEYDVYVRTDCGGNMSIWSRPASFITECDPITVSDLPYEESFDAYPTGSDSYIDCWRRYTNYSTSTSYPYISSVYSNSASNSLYFYASSTTYTYAVLHALEESIPMDTIMVQFNLRSSSTSTGIIVGTMSNYYDISTFVAIDTVRPASSLTNQFYRANVFFRNYSGTGRYIAFKYTGSSSVYLDDLVVDYIPSCLFPTDVAILSDNITDTSIPVTWTENRSATQWEIEYCEPGVSQGSGNRVMANSNPFTITSLNDNTTYTIYVRSICAPGDTSDWSFPVTSTTLCSPYSLPFEEDFNNYATTGDQLPICWSQMRGKLPTDGTTTELSTLPLSTSFTWKVRNFANITGNPSMCLDIYGTTKYDWLFTPSMDLGNTGNILLEFDLVLRKWNTTEPPVTTGTDDKFIVLMSSDGTWTIHDTLAAWDNQGSGRVYNNISSSDNGEKISIRVTGVTGVVQFAFYGESTESNADNGIFVDNILIEELPVCSEPSNIQVHDTTDNSARITWTPGGSETEWIVEYGIAGTGSTLYDTVSQPETTLLNLSPNSLYDVRVKAICHAVNHSEYVHSTFQTLEDNTGVRPHELSQNVQIFPNPTKRILNVKSEVRFELVEICNSMGQVIDKVIVNDTEFSIDVSSYSSGIYFLHLKDQYGVVTKKFVKE